MCFLLDFWKWDRDSEKSSPVHAKGISFAFTFLCPEVAVKDLCSRDDEVPAASETMMSLSTVANAWKA